MKWILLVVLCLLGAFQIKSQQVPVMDFSKFEPYLRNNNDTIYIVNFWATWCTPCVDEIPALEKIAQKYSNQKVKVILVSLDFRKQLEERLIPFIKKHNIKSQVILLNDPKQNQWIDKVDPKWTGAIPFTQVYGKGFRDSYEKVFNYKELDSIIQLKLKKL